MLEASTVGILSPIRHAYPKWLICFPVFFAVRMLEKARANGTVVKATQSDLYAQVSSVNTADPTNSQTSKN